MTQRLSTPGNFTFTATVAKKLGEVAKLHQERIGNPLRPPETLLPDLKRWRAMQQRQQLDILLDRVAYHTADESRSELDIAQWLVTEWHRLLGTEPAEPFEPMVQGH